MHMKTCDFRAWSVNEKLNYYTKTEDADGKLVMYVLYMTQLEAIRSVVIVCWRVWSLYLSAHGWLNREKIALTCKWSNNFHIMRLFVCNITWRTYEIFSSWISSVNIGINYVYIIALKYISGMLALVNVCSHSFGPSKRTFSVFFNN